MLSISALYMLLATASIGVAQIAATKENCSLLVSRIYPLFKVTMGKHTKALSVRIS